MKRTLVIILCCSCLLSTACTNEKTLTEHMAESIKYKRISFDQETLGESLVEHIDSDTIVINNVKAEFPAQIPIYKIKESKFSEEEFAQVKKSVKAAWETAPNGATPPGWEMEGNEIHGFFAYEDEEAFTMTEEELEKIAWETFRKLPFVEGEYEYSGIRGRSITSYVDGRPDVTTRVMVSFFPVLDGLRVIGNDRCDMWFEDTGLVEIHLKRYEYETIGTMDVVPVKEAEAQIKTPDDFVMEEGTGKAQTLRVEGIKLRLVNQHSDGCTILQPLYVFGGVATTKEKEETDFQSRIIAIPESYTYEAK